MTYDPRDWYWDVVDHDPARVYASARAAFVAVDDKAYVAWRAAGYIPTRVASFDKLVDVLRASSVPPYHKVSTYRILRRLEDAGLIDVADAALNANRTLFRRFYTVGAISADEPDAREFLKKIGADPDAILAPE